MIQALIDGQTYSRTRRVWRENDAGERVLVERPKRMRPWYWMSGSGGCYSQVWYGSKVLEMKPGITAIQVATKEDLTDVIRSVMEVVKFDETDIQIEDVAEKGTELRLKQKPAAVKKAG
jgi:hypothetical protein